MKFLKVHRKEFTKSLTFSLRKLLYLKKIKSAIRKLTSNWLIKLRLWNKLWEKTLKPKLNQLVESVAANWNAKNLFYAEFLTMTKCPSSLCNQWVGGECLTAIDVTSVRAGSTSCTYMTEQNIEWTFHQTSFRNFACYGSISPRVTGTFEESVPRFTQVVCGTLSPKQSKLPKCAHY
jgi:hypothetical protein